jgi:hypothetical protein
VNVRAVSRVQPESSGFSFGGRGQLALSMSDGLVVDRNIAQRKMEALRKALRWTITPVRIRVHGRGAAPPVTHGEAAAGWQLPCLVCHVVSSRRQRVGWGGGGGGRATV